MHNRDLRHRFMSHACRSCAAQARALYDLPVVPRCLPHLSAFSSECLFRGGIVGVSRRVVQAKPTAGKHSFIERAHYATRTKDWVQDFVPLLVSLRSFCIMRQLNAGHVDGNDVFRH